MHSITIDFDFEREFQSKIPLIGKMHKGIKDEIGRWTDIRDFILERSNVEVLIDSELVIKDLSINNPIIFKLLNDYLQNTNDVRIVKPEIISAERYIFKKQHYFFIENTNSLNFNPLEYGFKVYNTQNILSDWKWKSNYTFSHRNESTEFSFEVIKEFKHPSNEIIIIDRYLLNNISKFIYNVTKLIESIIIPSNSIRIYIFSSSSDLDKSLNGDLEIIKNNLFYSLKDLLNDINIEIFLDKRSNNIQDRTTGNNIAIFHREHSRYVFTYDLMLKAGQGLHFYSAPNLKNKNYSDEITLSPLHQFENKRIANNVLKSLLNIVQNKTNIQNNKYEIFENTINNWLNFVNNS